MSKVFLEKNRDICAFMSKTEEQPNNPLHGVTLKEILETLVERYGWTLLGAQINIKCFTNNPSMQSSLKFLRKTPWAREKVERLYINAIKR